MPAGKTLQRLLPVTAASALDYRQAPYGQHSRSSQLVALRVNLGEQTTVILQTTNRNRGENRTDLHVVRRQVLVDGQGTVRRTEETGRLPVVHDAVVSCHQRAKPGPIRQLTGVGRIPCEPTLILKTLTPSLAVTACTIECRDPLTRSCPG